MPSAERSSCLDVVCSPVMALVVPTSNARTAARSRALASPGKRSLRSESWSISAWPDGRGEADAHQRGEQSARVFAWAVRLLGAPHHATPSMLGMRAQRHRPAELLRIRCCWHLALSWLSASPAMRASERVATVQQVATNHDEVPVRFDAPVEHSLRSHLLLLPST
jgi:hypothetical protein